MSNTENENTDEDKVEISETATESLNEGEAQSDIQMENDVSVLQTRIIEMEAEVASMKDKALRALADAENTRKRAEREKADASKFAIAKFARDLLEVADNMRRAIESIPADQKDSSDLIKNLVIGVEATEKSMLNVFDRHGVEQIAPTEGKFDPNMHEAMFEGEDPSKKPGDIMQLIEPGYILNGRLIRPARVGVVKASGTETKVDQQA